jgi:hypothetical protein
MNEEVGFLKGNPIPWLLEDDNPSVRYWTLVEVLEEPGDGDDILKTKKAISQQSLAKQLFGLQKPGGYWGEDESKPYTAQGAVGVLSVLCMLGVSPDERTSAGCESFLRFSQTERGAFSMVKTRPSGVFPCTTGEHLPFLSYFGFIDDRRVRKAFTYLIESMMEKEALICGRYQNRVCLWGAIAALKGLAVLPDQLQSAESQQVVRRLADALLDADYDFTGEHKRWFTFSVPRAWDLLSALRVLALHGYGEDPRYSQLLKLVLDRQDEQGRWACGSVSHTWPLEKRNQPSKWVTLDVLRLFKAIGNTFISDA